MLRISKRNHQLEISEHDLCKGIRLNSTQPDINLHFSRCHHVVNLVLTFFFISFREDRTWYFQEMGCKQTATKIFENWKFQKPSQASFTKFIGFAMFLLSLIRWRLVLLFQDPFFSSFPFVLILQCAPRISCRGLCCYYYYYSCPHFLVEIEY